MPTKTVAAKKTMNVETIAVEQLKPHPRNYKRHPEEQIAHLMSSITEHGMYRNVVIARDDTILAGHGVVEAAKRLGKTHVPVVRLPIDPNDTKALKLVVADNEIGSLAERDDAALLAILLDVATNDELLGTGFDKELAAALAFVTSPPGTKKTDVDAEWLAAGAPDASPGAPRTVLVIHFDSDKDREKYVKEHKVQVTRKSLKYGNELWSAWWPFKKERGHSGALSLKYKAKAKK